VTVASTTLLFMTARAEHSESALDTTSDRRRVEELFVRLEVRLTNVVYRWLWNREEVRDVVQEAFVRLWQMRERVDWERAEPLVYRIALNLASKRRRWSRLWQFVALADREIELEPEANPARDEAVRQAIDTLPDRHRRVLVMTMHSEMTYDEIGEVLGISAGTVASRRNAAIHKLRGMLRRGSDD